MEAPRLWRGIGLWAVACGLLAAGQVPADAPSWAAAGLVAILVGLGWGNMWDLAVGTDWPGRLWMARSRERPSPEGRLHPEQGTRRPVLPYTRPGSPAWRIGRVLGRLAAWLKCFWPEFRAEVLGLLGALALVGLLIALLPERLYPVHAALLSIVGLGIAWRRQGRHLLLGQAAVCVGLAWLAGNLVLGVASVPAVALAGIFTAAAWGALRVARGRMASGLWLLNGSQIAGIVLLAAVHQPLAAAAVGLLWLGQVALQPALNWGADRRVTVQRVWPWLMAAGMVAALAVR